MKNTLSQKSLKKLSLNFRTVASRLLRTDYVDGMSNLKRFIDFVDNTLLIKSYINSYKYEFDVEQEVKECELNAMMIYSIPTEKPAEVSFIYQILKYYIDNYESYIQPIPRSYGHSSNYQDQVDGFNNRVVLPFVDHINCYLEEQYIEFGDEALNNKITIHNDSGQVNLAQDNANITATQNVNTEVIDLMGKLITQLQKENCEGKEELNELLETVIDNLKCNKPKKTIISILTSKIKEFVSLTGISMTAIDTAEKALPYLESLL